jgi:hypothetical protein
MLLEHWSQLVSVLTLKLLHKQPAKQSIDGGGLL